MSDAVPHQEVGLEQAASSLTAEEYNAFVHAISLNDIVIVAQSSERTGEGESDFARFELKAAYQVIDGGLHYRFDASATILAEDNSEVGVARAAVVVAIGCSSLPPAETIEYFGATSVPMMAHPYVREALLDRCRTSWISGHHPADHHAQADPEDSRLSE